MTVSVVFYDPNPDDPTSGPVINTYFGNPQNIPKSTSTAPIPDGVVIDDVRKWAVQNGQVVPATYQVEPWEVNRERDRRVLLGKGFDLSAYGYGAQIPVAGDPTSQMNLMGLAVGVVLRVLFNDADFLAKVAQDPTMTEFRDAANNLHQLNSTQVAMLWLLGAVYVSDVFRASWQIKDDPNGISPGFEADPRWPT